MGLAGFSMVGVARIELATPAMSTQLGVQIPRFSADFSITRVGTYREYIANIERSYRNFTAS
jgi:hypothetical protein